MNRNYSLTMEGGRRCYRVTCKKCGVHGTVAPNNSAGTLPPEVIRKKLVQKGWSIGQGPSSDLCPGCLLEKAPPRSLVLKFPGSNASLPIGVVEMPQIVKAEPPREMAKDDRRIILAKLGEVYLDEKRGYCDDWNDDRVAKDLGIPRAWVARLREENFGPESGAKPQSQAIILAAVRMCQHLELSIKSSRTHWQKVKDDIVARENDMAALENSVRDLQRLCSEALKSAA